MRLAITLALLMTFGLHRAALAQGTEDEPLRTTERVAEGQPRYLEAMRRELAAMNVRDFECEASDPQHGQCRFEARGISTEREFTVGAVYSDRTDTIYLYVDRFLILPTDGPTTPAVLGRMMELNWALLLAKFEWNSTDGEVRLAMVLNTDSNFDRRAFRSAVRSITQLADRYWSELDALLRAHAPAE